MIRRRDSERGSGLVELALGLSFLTLLFVALVQLALGVVTYGQLREAVDRAALFAATDSIAEPATAYLERVKHVAVYGHPELEERGGTAGLELSQVQVEILRDSKGAPQAVEVRIEGYGMPLAWQGELLKLAPASVVNYRGRWMPAGLIGQP